MTRKLVTIREVGRIEPIDGADRIELAHIDGWQCVVRKGEFKPGDRCLFFEIDSVLPELAPFAFLKNFRELYNGKRGSVLKTVRLRNQISQGLALPLSVCDNLGIEDVDSVGDLADAIGVWKYDPPPPTSLGGDPVGKNPSWFPRTDEERVQNMRPDQLAGSWSITEKIDGASMSVWVENGIVGVGGHTWAFDSVKSSSSYARVARESGILEWLAKQPSRLCIQGELAGPGIQGNPLRLDRLTFFIFMIHDGTTKFTQEAIDYIYSKMDTVDKTTVRQVPAVGFVDFSGTQDDIDLALKWANGSSLVSPLRPCEGLVFRDEVDGNRSFKSVSAEYLANE